MRGEYPYPLGEFVRLKITWASFGFAAILLQTPFPHERILDPQGWNLPDVKMLTLEKVENRTYPGIPCDIKIEFYGYMDRYKAGAGYYILNPPADSNKTIEPSLLMKEKVEGLDIYRSSNGIILCYRYSCITEGLTEESQLKVSRSLIRFIPTTTYGGKIAFIADLNNDGVNESCYRLSGHEVKDEKLLISILKAKLGLINEER